MNLHMHIHALSRLPRFYEDGFRVRVIYGFFNAENTWEAIETLKTQPRTNETEVKVTQDINFYTEKADLEPQNYLKI